MQSRGDRSSIILKAITIADSSVSLILFKILLKSLWLHSKFCYWLQLRYIFLIVMDKTWFPWEIDASQSLEMHADCKVWPTLGWALWKSKIKLSGNSLGWESWKSYERPKDNILLFKKNYLRFPMFIYFPMVTSLCVTALLIIQDLFRHSDVALWQTNVYRLVDITLYCLYLSSDIFSSVIKSSSLGYQQFLLFFYSTLLYSTTTKLRTSILWQLWRLFGNYFQVQTKFVVSFVYPSSCSASPWKFTSLKSQSSIMFWHFWEIFGNIYKPHTAFVLMSNSSQLDFPFLLSFLWITALATVIVRHFHTTIYCITFN